MDFGIWAYPWDVIDEGVDSVGDRVFNLGISELNLATNYHSVQTFNPHNPERRTFFSRASAYFQPDGGYGRLKPVVNETMGDNDWVAEIDDGFRGTPIDLNSWTVGCHNSRLGANNPDLTLRSPHGDSLVFGLCPSQPAVQEYLVNLVRDLDSRASFNRIELETFDYFHGRGSGWHHDKFHIRLGALGEFLFGLCFCDACRDIASSTGIDVSHVQDTVINAVDALATSQIPHDLATGDWLVEHPAVFEYARQRCLTLKELYGDLAGVAANTDLGAYIGMFDVEASWRQGLDLNLLADDLDYYKVLAYGSDAAETVKPVKTAKHLTDAELHAGVLPAHPHVYDEDTLLDIVGALDDEGIPQVSFYNYGLVPDKNLEWIGTAADAV
ncbi:hypothetical protein [Natrialba sp. INN-245]|uniref:hypothetical protein n=1 Tax=Natrialba sp. INN-245 TaxID=2690967 RepID=UPI0013107310|nr:hypothetical protein [Natrialba sp. INN-245]MWV40676.1 hypothetical protein [Natrialba sp. INN-245]